MVIHQTKIILHRKEIINRMERQGTEQKKIFAMYTSDKRLISRIIRNSNNPIAKTNFKTS
jgi:hypothetical protein